MIADQVQEGVLADEIAGAQDGMAVAQGLGLRDEAQAAGMIAGHARVGHFVAGRDDDGDLFDAGAQGLFDDDAKHGFFDAIAIDQGLQRQAPLAGSGGRDHRLTDFHECSGSLDIMRDERRPLQCTWAISLAECAGRHGRCGPGSRRYGLTFAAASRRQ